MLNVIRNENDVETTLKILQVIKKYASKAEEWYFEPFNALFFVNAGTLPLFIGLGDYVCVSSKGQLFAIPGSNKHDTESNKTQ